MSPEEEEAELQEAASTRFGGGTIMLQPLTTGRWAVRGDDWELLAVVDPRDVDMPGFAEIIQEFSAKGRRGYVRMKLEEGPRPREQSSVVGKSAVELDL